MPEHVQTPGAVEDVAVARSDASLAAAAAPVLRADGLPSRGALAARPRAARALAATVGNRAMNRVLARQAPPLITGSTGSDFATAVGDEAISGGQFMFTVAIGDALEQRLTTLAGPGPVPPEVTAFRDVMGKLREPDFAARKAALASTLRASSHAAAPALLKLVGPDSAATSASGGQVVSDLWTAFKTPGATFPDLSAVTTLAHLKGVDAWESIACWTTAERVGAKFAAAMKKKYSQPLRPETAVRNTPVMASLAKADRAADRVELAAGHRVRGDEVVYDKRLPGIVDKMKAAVTDGWVLHVRVVSGIYLDMAGAGTPTEEHSLLIYGTAGDEFFAFDPDAASNTAAPRAAAGFAPAGRMAFQSLFFDRAANRLSTAETDADFKVDHPHGRHANGVHRYQVVRVFTSGKY